MERLIDEAPIPWRAPKEMEELWNNVRAALLRLLDDSESAEQLAPKEQIETRFAEEDWLSSLLLEPIPIPLGGIAARAPQLRSGDALVAEIAENLGYGIGSNRG